MGRVGIVKLGRIMGIITRDYGLQVHRRGSQDENARAYAMRRPQFCLCSGVL